ncbi:MAG: hypothetical protein H6983_02645 [Ectothiorhodospiraceae bacterium]|nr:hypothetical protein [Ectothiorhodospiraceae bacterium]
MSTGDDDTTRLAGLAAALGEATARADVESAFSAITAGLLAANGDREAHLRPGALRPGERQFAVCGIFLLTTDGEHHLLVAEQGFPPEQHRLRIPADLGHPGQVRRERAPLLLANTDEHADFRQILKTARMGSAAYAPLLWQGRYLGQIVNAAQARHTMGPGDLQRVIIAAATAAALHVAHDAARWLTALDC